MLKQAIQELAQAPSLIALANSIQAAMSASGEQLIAMPDSYTLTNLEKYMPNRRRMCGTMNTTIASDFAKYSCANSEENGAVVFVDGASMKATAVLNFGTPVMPGHADNLAIFTPKETAAYKALKKVLQAGFVQQGAMAEFLEDWDDYIECLYDGQVIQNRKAISAIRKISIEAMQKLEVEEQSLSQTKSTLESVKATSTEQIPTLIKFTCYPYSDIDARCFALRLAIQTGGNIPTIALRMIQEELHAEEIASEFVALIAECIAEQENKLAVELNIDVVIGTYSLK